MDNNEKTDFFAINFQPFGLHDRRPPMFTNISSDGANGLNIEKCTVELNAFLGVVNTGDCINSNIKLAR